ncbi:cadherin-99C [Phlebotomus argentipes]|uniref:cadherin-99C n=1 Tax=Phlebotomus argentipes TaxID=94469 RepID=UPI0028930734|nr:cadherin-99C [Phlebotomus argentipes]
MTPWHWMILHIILLVCCETVQGAWGKLQPCEVETGQTNIILDIEESRGDSIGQRTIPPELPIYGDPDSEILLDLVFPKGNKMFVLNGKALQLIKPLDRDEENLSHTIFQISCTIRSTHRKRNIPIIVRVSDVNDNAPVFINTPYETTVPESTPVGTTIFRNILAQDIDAGVNGLVEYFIVEGTKNITDDKVIAADGYGTFSIGFPHQGQVTVAKTLDYERIQRYYLTIVASDRARNVSERLTATTTLTINVADSDDMDPSFIYRGCILLDGACINPEYTASVPSGSLQGVLSVLPEKIQAIDLDTISSPIRYTFLSGMPSNYDEFFAIDEQTGILKQVKVIDTSVAKKFDIIVKAEEVSEARRFTTAKLSITVKPVDSNPPVIASSDTEGFVDENSSIGTKIVDSKGMPIRLTTTDADFTDDDPKPDYIYELTTPYFTVSDDGNLLVNEENLDRDPPNPGVFRFQVVSREKSTNVASAPLSLTVTLRDVNDNPPKLPMIAPVTIMAGDETRFVTKVTATDNDMGENAVITYSIYHVSNNGVKKFSIDERSGVIETRGPLNAGEQYSITVQATDIGNLHSQAIVEVAVTPGPNTKPPRFVKPVYEVQVSEGADINATIVVVKAEDPENDPVKYAILSGNDLRQFSVAPDTGVISVIRKLDREDLTRYQLILRAEDNGGLATTATVNIRVTDINDNNPEFDENAQPYRFKVEEGRADTLVGVVHATDADDGVNADITYSLPSDIPFKIHPKSGEIRTTTALDYEKVKEYKFVVTAKDGAPDRRLGTASVSVEVTDVPDEVPVFSDDRLEVRVPENVPDLTIATVKAIDPDTKPEITYQMRQGASELFRVDPRNGQVKTIRGLDYEKEKTHELVIGTVENSGNEVGDVVRIHIDVEDRNDIPPVFVSVPEPVTVNDDQKIGTIVGSMPAIDGDGTAPGNVVRYEMVGRGKALKYFQVDPDTGVIRLRDELNKEDDTEYQVDVKAFDLGDPQLSSVATLPVFVRHLLNDPNGGGGEYEARVESGNLNSGTFSNQIGLAFSEDNYVAHVSETALANSTVKAIQIVNSKKATKVNPGFKCDIIKGNIFGQFRAVVENHSCVVSLNRQLDYENKTLHDLDVKLSSLKYFVNPLKSVTKLKIVVQDENDNPPVFVIPTYSTDTQHPDTYYGVVPVDADIDTPILQVKATDKDSGKFGMIKYRLLGSETNHVTTDEEATSYFAISEDTGIVKLQKSVKNLKYSPVILSVEAMDNNGQSDSPFNTAFARIVINTIADINRMSLVFSDASPKDVKSHGRALEELFSEKTSGLIAGIERFSNRKFLTDNGTVEEDPNATDVWFYVIDPKTETILSRNSSEVKSQLIEADAQSELSFAASGIAKATAQGIYAPVESRRHIHKVRTAIAVDNDVFPYALIAVSLVILILGTIGIIYICVSWSRYKNFKERLRHYPTPPNPMRYDPVIIGNHNADASTTSLKEYETQVLAMAVNADQEDDLQMDFSTKNHAFTLDNVSYITHKENGGRSPSHSEATTAAMSTLQRNNNNNLNNQATGNNRQNTFNRALEINRNNANPLGKNAGTLTLGRIKSERNHYNNGYGMNSLSRNNLTQNNTFNTLNGTTCNMYSGGDSNELMTNTLGRNNRHQKDIMPVTSPLFQQRQYGGAHFNHPSATNENVTFANKDYNPLGFAYLNDLDRSDVETTTEL